MCILAKRYNSEFKSPGRHITMAHYPRILTIDISFIFI
ncbi:MAG: hypothetical protein ACI9WS_002482 [Paraglaciecola psychrophila]